MFAVKGMYDGKSVIVDNPIPTKEKYEVIVTFLSAIGSEKNINDENDERKKAFEFLTNFTKKKLPKNFNYKQELLNSLEKKYGSFD